MPARPGTIPRFQEGERLLSLLENKVLDFVHPLPGPAQDTHDDNTEAPHLQQIGILVTPPMVDLFEFVVARLGRCPGSIVTVGGPPFAGKSQALKILAAGLHLKFPMKQVFYCRDPPAPSCLVGFPEGCIVIVDQVQNLKDYKNCGGTYFLILATSAGLVYPDRVDPDQTPLVSFDFPLDVGRDAFRLAVHAASKATPPPRLTAIPAPAAATTTISTSTNTNTSTSTSSPSPGVPQTEEEVDRLYAFLGGSLLAAMSLLSWRQFPSLLTKSPDTLEGVPVPPELVPYPPASRLLAALIGQMTGPLESKERSGYFSDVSVMCAGADSDTIYSRAAPHMDLRWFVPTGYHPQLIRIASPLYRLALSLAVRGARPAVAECIPDCDRSQPNEVELPGADGRKSE
ncbi:hypothetical protein PAPYR_7959 [Paratrimastix pyriformis]|uniref:Uncharacterized protein n=1 Tax=Paratrimastix pyriformis TaxID=342808 RepID=A0ABQ8UED8_9EUKA|nr:hypothetical protein PAPYR_7959 [Paratrimastix pyriformis]